MNKPNPTALLLGAALALYFVAHHRRRSRISHAIGATVPDIPTGNSPEELPPKFEEEYYRADDRVFVSRHHGENELKENIRIARAIAAKIKDNVYLLPRLDPYDPRLTPLRKTLLIKGIEENKSPDFMIKGRFFEGKCLFGLKNYERAYVKQAIENRIKKAKQQADNIILEIPSRVPRKYIEETVKNYLNRSNKNREIWVLWKNKLLKIKKALI